jgi:hypothetical protein
MDTVGILLKDPPFWAAAAAFIAGLSAFLWSALHLRAMSSQGLASSSARAFPSPDPVKVKGKDGRWNFPPPETPPSSVPDADATVRMSPAASTPRPSAPVAAPVSPEPRVDPSVVLGIVEEKFTDMGKRLAALEHPKVGQAPAYLDPLLKRFQEMENELKNLKFAFTQLASAQNAINVGEITAKIQGIQKVLENLTSGTDVSKPS